MPLGVFAVTLLVYLLTLAPTVTGEDSGELIAAAYTLGIPHPSGYPLWCLVTQPFLLLPVGDIAYRANLGSAVTTALACAALVAWLRTLKVPALHTVGPALLLAFSSTLWSQSVIAEVYPLTLLTLILLGLSLSRWQAQPHSQKWLHLSAFLSGLCLTAHHTVLILYPLIFGYALKVGGKQLLRPTVWLALLAGVSIYAYLPIRAAAHPAMNWGNPDTAQRFWAHVTRAQYPSLLATHHSLALSLGQLKTTALYFVHQWPWPVSLLVAAGALLGVRGHKMLTAAFLLLSIGFTLLLNFNLAYEDVHIAEVFFIPAWLIAVVLLALGSQKLGKVGAAATLVMAVISLLGNISACTMAGNKVARRYAQDVLRTLPPNSLLFTGADYETFPITYLQVVEHQRPDVIALNEDTDLARAEQLLRTGPHPLYSNRPLDAFPAGRWMPIGLLYANLLDPKGAAELDEIAWQLYRPRVPEGPWKNDWSTASLLGRYELAQARGQLLYSSDPAAAFKLLAQSAARQPQDPLLMNSLGALLTRAGHPEEALVYYQKAIALKPDYDKAHYNYILALGSLGRWDEARLDFSKSLKGREPNLEKVLLQAQVLQPDLLEAESLVASQPQDGQAWLRLGLLKVRLQMVGAEADLEKAVQLAPKNVDAWAQLGLWRAQKGDRAGAAHAWQEALRLSPQGPQAPLIRQQLEQL